MRNTKFSFLWIFESKSILKIRLLWRKMSIDKKWPIKIKESVECHSETSSSQTLSRIFLSRFFVQNDIFGRISKIESWELISVLVRLQLLESFPLRKKIAEKNFRWNFEEKSPKIVDFASFQCIFSSESRFLKSPKMPFYFWTNFYGVSRIISKSRLSKEVPVWQIFIFTN